MKNCGVLVVIVLLLSMGVGCEVWRWRECRKVGHGAMYCILNVGKE